MYRQETREREFKMFVYLIYGPTDGFGNDVYVAEPKVFTSFEKACTVANEANEEAGQDSVTQYLSFHNREDAVKVCGEEKILQYEKDLQECGYEMDDDDYCDVAVDISLQEYYEQMCQIDFYDIDSVSCFTPVKIELD